MVTTKEETPKYVATEGAKKQSPETSKVPNEKYFWVRFQAKSDPTHKDDVELSVNGETLVLQREKRVALPERFLECADHARYTKFKQLPGEDRKNIAHIRMFPYERLEEATAKEFYSQKAEGTKITKAAMG